GWLPCDVELTYNCEKGQFPLAELAMSFALLTEVDSSSIEDTSCPSIQPLPLVATVSTSNVDRYLCDYKSQRASAVFDHVNWIEMRFKMEDYDLRGDLGNVQHQSRVITNCIGQEEEDVVAVQD